MNLNLNFKIINFIKNLPKKSFIIRVLYNTINTIIELP